MSTSGTAGTTAATAGSAAAAVRARLAASGVGARKPYTSKFRSGATGSVLDSLSSLPLNSAFEKKPSIVLEIGAAYTKVGFSNEPQPRHVFRSTVEVDGVETRVFDAEEQRSSAELRELLITFLNDIMYRRLLVKTVDRRAVVCEGIVVPSVYRSLLADILYRSFMFSSVLFAPNPVLATLPTWLDSALVVDVGYTETTVVAVFDGVAAINTFTAVPTGGAEMHRQIRAKLNESGQNVDEVHVDERVIEDIKVRTCIAGKLPPGKELPSLRYPLRGLPALQLDGSLRATALDPVFEGVGSDGCSIPSAILDTLLRCPCDSRKMLAKRILVTGGGSMLPGFKHRLSEKLKELIKEDDYAELAGIVAERTVLNVKIARVGIEDKAVFTNRGTYDRLLDDIVRRIGVQVSNTTSRTEDGTIVLTIVTPDEVDVAALENAKINMGETSYVATSVSTEKQEYHTGVSQLFSFVKSDFPENILCWLGGSILGGLENIAEVSLSKDAYLKSRSLPDWSDLRPRARHVSKQEPKTAHRVHKLVDRPRAWGCGSLAVVDTKKKTAYPEHQGYLENAAFSANPILHVQ